MSWPVKEYINREEAIKTIINLGREVAMEAEEQDIEKVAKLCGDIIFAIMSLPKITEDKITNDVQEVVRCGDCRFLTFSDMYGECGKGIMGVVNPNDYCSRGERRDE